LFHYAIISNHAYLGSAAIWFHLCFDDGASHNAGMYFVRYCALGFGLILFIYWRYGAHDAPRNFPSEVAFDVAHPCWSSNHATVIDDLVKVRMLFAQA
jgi:hypothetical protein